MKAACEKDPKKRFNFAYRLTGGFCSGSGSHFRHTAHKLSERRAIFWKLYRDSFGRALSELIAQARARPVVRADEP